MWEEKIKKFQEWDLLANYLSLKLKWIVVLRNILQINYGHVICYIDLTSYKYYYIKKVCFDDRKHVLLHCQFTSLYAKEWVKWTPIIWEKQNKILCIGIGNIDIYM